ncbi:VWA domain-containing protein [Aquihabitans sp. G128]|uniref:type II secretion system F family protein n=1 Tax=Aquihabitans sp. G128 TaxID=2849779 RepID=UPI001C249E64|nr:type II secretion system F family protein [Aquihabitans sp. G128]QXC61687.1 VWA domain-containing protein [Aquihabitans sp. G128]
MVKPIRTLRLLGAAGLVAGLMALSAAPAAVAQEAKGLLTVRSIDATDKAHVGVTFLWTGTPTDLEGLTIREDGAVKKVDSLVDLRKTDKRMGTVVVVDLSGSMLDDGALARAKSGVEAIAAGLPEGDQMAVVGFNDEVVVETGFTSDQGQIDAALDGLAAPRDGKTALYDGLRKAATLFESRPGLQPNVLLVTDGGDDASTSDLGAARASIVGSGAALFAVDLSHKGETDTKAIQSIIDRTGGTLVSGSSQAEVAKAFTTVDTTMRSQYVATYASTATQGAVNVSVAVGSVEQQASFVVGSSVQGAATGQSVTADKAFGPEWLRSSGGALLALVLIGLAAGLGAFSIAALATKNDTGLSAMLRPYEEGGVSPDDAGDSALAQTALLQRAVEITEDFAQRQGMLEKVENLLERADLPLRAAEALFFYAAGVLVVGLLGLVSFGPIGGLVLLIIAALIPPAALSFIAGRRGKAFVGQLPDTLGLLSGSLRAGYSLMQGVEAVSQEVEEPMGKELRRVITEARLGREIEDAMDSVAERMASPDFAWAVMAVRIQREVGGNLSELLMTVADTMVHRDRLRRDVAALTAEGKISAIILGLLPIGLGLFMWLSNPEYMAPLGNTFLGNVLLGVSFISICIGFVWMKKTITIEI